MPVMTVAAEDEAVVFFGLHTEDGIQGMFSRQHAAGAYSNGTRIFKLKNEPGDMTPIGTHGTVLGSVPAAPVLPDGYIYFVTWDNAPKRAVAVSSPKIERMP